MPEGRVTTSTVLFCDLVGSTAQRTALGDDAADRLAISLDAILREAVGRNHGSVIKSTGDGLMAIFDATSDALSAAVGAQQATDLHNRDTADVERLVLRIGISAGDVHFVAHDCHGTPVVEAARLESAADPGTIYVSGLVRALAGSRGGHRFNAVGVLELKGLEPVEAFRVPWEPLVEALPRIRVVIAEDAALIRAGLVQLLTSAAFDVVAETDNFDALVTAVDQHAPDLVITDIRMPPTQTDEGLRAAAHIKATHPGIAVLVLSQYVETGAAAALLDGQSAGIGYILKERVSELDEFIDVARRVTAGASVIDPLITEALLRPHRDDSLATLSEREREVLGLMAQGSSNQAISDTLFVSVKTVESHVRSIFIKLDLPEDTQGNRRVQAVVRWLEAR